MTSILLVNLQRAHQQIRKELDAAICGVIDRGDFVLGSHVEAFEEEFARYCGVKHCVGVGNGGDALVLSLKGLGIGAGDEVITAANTFAATVLAIAAAAELIQFTQPGRIADVTDPLLALTGASMVVLAHRYLGVEPAVATVPERDRPRRRQD